MRLLILAALVFLVLSSSDRVLAVENDQYSSDLATLETRLFEHTYSDDTIDQRLDRLDKMVFGRIRHGSDQERMTSLLMDVPAVSSSSADSPADSSTVPSKKAAPRLQGERPVTSVQPSVNPASDQSADYYPTVTALEERIAGKTETSLPVQQRLAALETIAFGKPSTSNDLSERVDRLKKYVHSKYGSDENYLTPSNAVGWTASNSGLDSEVTSMEQEVFGKTFARDNLTSRLSRLEKNVLPKEPDQSFTPIPTRVQRLVSSLHPMGARGQTYESSPENQSMLATAKDNNAKKKHHLLHTLGIVAGDVGGLALRSMMYGGYGYGW